VGNVSEMSLVCRVCRGRAVVPAGHVYGRIAERTFKLAHCTTCRFSFVVDPWTDYATIYSEAYYGGRGADPYIDYAFELEHFERTVRRYEWAGLLRAASTLVPMTAAIRWLDFGCGNGGLLRWARERAGITAVGYDTGWVADRLREAGFPLLCENEFDGVAGTFDLVTAIETIEHIVDPIAALRTIARLLKPGGVLLLTTGNAKPFRKRLATWRYVIPEIHVSFFEPQTMARAYAEAGLAPSFRGFLPGYDQVIRFKVLKALGVREPRTWERLIPWGVAARAVDARWKVTGHPVGTRGPL
jgi:SAM-dependent methyltransferase